MQFSQSVNYFQTIINFITYTTSDSELKYMISLRGGEEEEWRTLSPPL